MLKNNQFIAELAETGPVLCLSPITDLRFAYGLANGTIGIYEEGIRLWRVKVSNLCISKYITFLNATDHSNNHHFVLVVEAERSFSAMVRRDSGLLLG